MTFWTCSGPSDRRLCSDSVESLRSLLISSSAVRLLQATTQGGGRLSSVSFTETKPTELWGKVRACENQKKKKKAVREVKIPCYCVTWWRMTVWREGECSELWRVAVCTMGWPLRQNVDAEVFYLFCVSQTVTVSARRSLICAGGINGSLTFSCWCWRSVVFVFKGTRGSRFHRPHLAFVDCYFTERYEVYITT